MHIMLLVDNIKSSGMQGLCKYPESIAIFKYKEHILVAQFAGSCSRGS